MDQVLQFDTVANPQLTDPEFTPAATLAESATAQTRLNQVFVVNDDDRYLSFTVADAALGDQADGPDDAFEVALLDANTGASLLGGTGLTHSDALLNRQANGAESTASGIDVVVNADGSRSYRIDLAGIAAGTAVNLSFDLIGFGQGLAARNSHVTLRNLHLGGLDAAPQTRDDAVTLAEDTPLLLDALANDLDARQPGFAPVLVAAAAHGQVTVNADGSFGYTPEADWFGSDRFSYRLSDGRLDSNVATVTLTVTPVNDAPTLAERSVVLDEDGRVTVDLLAGAADSDGDKLTATVTTLPQHDNFSQNADGTWTYAPAADWNGRDQVEFEVSDGTAATASRITFVVAAVNDAPTLADSAASGFEDQPLHGQLLTPAADPDGDPLTVRLLDGPAHGTLTLTDDGGFTYTPAANWSGDDSFTYLVNNGHLDSPSARVRLHVAAVADTPTLTLTDPPEERREIFHTGWESANNPTRKATWLPIGEFEGWTLLRSGISVVNDIDGLTIWSSGDTLIDAKFVAHTVGAPPEGSNCLEIIDTGGGMNQTRGIERCFDTVAGATYAFSLELAGHSGFPAERTRIGIYLDGVRMDGDAGTSGTTSLDWRHRVIQFVGTGTPRTLRLVSEASVSGWLGGMLLDNLRLVETLPPRTGFEETAIRLPTIVAAPNDHDGSETLAVTIAALPIGCVLSDGWHVFTATADRTQAEVTAWALDALTLRPPADFNGAFTLSVLATAREGSGGETARGEARLPITVLPVNDPPRFTRTTSYRAVAGQPTVLPLRADLADVDGDALRIVAVSAPEHGRIECDATGDYRYTASPDYVGADRFLLTFSDGRVVVTQAVDLTVVAGTAYRTPCRHAQRIVVSSPADARGERARLAEAAWERLASSAERGRPSVSGIPLVAGLPRLADVFAPAETQRQAEQTPTRDDRPCIDWHSQTKPLAGLALPPDGRRIDPALTAPTQKSLAESSGLSVAIRR